MSTTTRPTAPVAPITPTLGMLALRLWRVELEGVVQHRDGRVDLIGADVAGDLDRRGRDDFGLDPGLGQRRERLCRHARVALHARADHAHLAEVVARAPLHAE